MTDQKTNGHTHPVEAVPWARQAGGTQPRATNRVRRLVSGLPAWEPTPPGEIVVQRHRQR